MIELRRLTKRYGKTTTLKMINRLIEPTAYQHRALSRKLRGHCEYYGITGNADQLSSFRTHVTRLWHKWLNRRSQRGNMSWSGFVRHLDR